MSASLIVKTPPTQEPMDLPSAKAHLRVDVTDDDQLIAGLIKAARSRFEKHYELALLTQTLVMGLDAFPDSMFLSLGWVVPASGVIYLRPPVQSVTTVTYVDPSGSTQTLAPTNYILDKDSQPARLMPALAKIWPVTAPVPGAVKVEFVAGYTAPTAVPDDIVAAMKLFIGHLYENRESVVVADAARVAMVELPQAVEAIMGDYRPWLVA